MLFFPQITTAEQFSINWTYCGLDWCLTGNCHLFTMPDMSEGNLSVTGLLLYTLRLVEMLTKKKKKRNGWHPQQR